MRPQLRFNSLMAALILSVGATLPMVQPTAAPRRSRKPGRSAGRVRRYAGKRYPEQSSRQAVRGARRAQGGPGIELVGNVWQARG